MLGRRIVRVIAVLSLCLATNAGTANAQDGDYAWGEEGGGSVGSGPSTEDPLRIMGFLGGGVGFRLLRNLDTPFEHEFLTPVYVDLGGAVYFPGAELRHGAGLAVSTNLTAGSGRSGIGEATQWVITPAYHLLIPLNRILGDVVEDMFQLQIRVGVPLVLGRNVDDPQAVDFTIGGELAFAFHLKFLAGFGMYIELQGDLIGGQNDGSARPTVHPFLAADLGFIIDYEVLP